MKKGKFIVIEGTDGSGKATQARLLGDFLIKQGYTIADFDFPQYGQPSAHFVERYLNGHYGSTNEVGPQRGSLFYALDRFEAGPKIQADINDGKLVLSNRYIGSNMGHQGAKFNNKKERKDYFQWVENLEFNILGIPKPDLNLILWMPADVAQALVDKKAARKYLGQKKRDIHEDDLQHLKNSEKAYLHMAELFPHYFKVVRCVEDGQLLSIEAIHKKIVEVVKGII